MANPSREAASQNQSGPAHETINRCTSLDFSFSPCNLPPIVRNMLGRTNSDPPARENAMRHPSPSHDLTTHPFTTAPRASQSKTMPASPGRHIKLHPHARPHRSATRHLPSIRHHYLPPTTLPTPRPAPKTPTLPPQAPLLNQLQPNPIPAPTGRSLTASPHHRITLSPCHLVTLSRPPPPPTRVFTVNLRHIPQSRTSHSNRPATFHPLRPRGSLPYNAPLSPGPPGPPDPRTTLHKGSA